jgi:regulatory protein
VISHKSGGARSRGRPRRLTPEALERAALAYLERYSASADSLRRVLLRRVERSHRVHGTDRNEGAAWVESLVQRYRDAGVIDDRRFAEFRAASLRRQGRSRRAIAEALALKGVDRDLANAALAAADANTPEPELAAALAYARRRRLGPFRPVKLRAAKRDLDLAALGRAGFSYDVARRIVEATSPDAVDRGAG